MTSRAAAKPLALVLLAASAVLWAPPATAAMPPAEAVTQLATEGSDGARGTHVLKEPTVAMALTGMTDVRLPKEAVRLMASRPSRRGPEDFIAHWAAVICLLVLISVGRDRREAGYRWILRK